MPKLWMGQVKTATEELDERSPPSTNVPKYARRHPLSSSIHSLVVSDACFAVQHLVFLKGDRPSPLRPPLPRFRSSPCLQFDDLFVQNIDRGVPLARKVTPFTEQRFTRRGECLDLNDSDDVSLFYQPSLSMESSLMQACHKHVKVDVQRAGKAVMALLSFMHSFRIKGFKHRFVKCFDVDFLFSKPSLGNESICVTNKSKLIFKVISRCRRVPEGKNRSQNIEIYSSNGIKGAFVDTWMVKPGTGQVKTAEEELELRFSLGKAGRRRLRSSAVNQSGHFIVFSERARAARLASTRLDPQYAIFPNRIQ
ncbi:hypothetical protein IW261DRAFT_1425110 [Armillaria novae-zelandiae]|uniref:Uncharacterized protein n=1 Tax=Armillaria novae-zelandiae TaxID=153914 RepID=A0AA39NTG1_9AGAR|nr:hypothetical protein IW261DRAFT_1425110 [Armillaria novae-zelandiae]